jgi:uncharacterized membrane protein YeaQ/YmgE (transglycosylase-associated protein family)
VQQWFQDALHWMSQVFANLPHWAQLVLDVLGQMPLWIHWVLLGFAAGALAKFLVPGRDPSGCIITVVLGIVGALIGGLIGTRLGWGAVTAVHFEPRSLGLATLGAVLILVISRLFRRL